MSSFWTSNELMREIKNHLLKADELQFTWFVITFIGKVNTAGNKANWFLWTYPISRTRRKERNHKAINDENALPQWRDISIFMNLTAKTGNTGIDLASSDCFTANFRSISIIGRIQHMEPRSMDLFVDLVHGLPPWNRPNFWWLIFTRGLHGSHAPRTTVKGISLGKSVPCDCTVWPHQFLVCTTW